MRRRTTVPLAAAFVAAALCVVLLPEGRYAEQFRDQTGAAATWRHPLGTDDLGRDRLSRLLYASSISLLLAGVAAAGAVVIAGVVGGFAGYCGGWRDHVVCRALDLLQSLPWLFLLLAVRAMLPLNVPPAEALVITYGLLMILGWASAARVVRAGVAAIRDSDFVLRARAQGCSEARILLWQLLPALQPILIAQFWTSIPIFLLAETNLGFLGLSAGEPFPTWGSLLRELQNPLVVPAAAFAPLVAVSAVLVGFKLLLPWAHSDL